MKFLLLVTMIACSFVSKSPSGTVIDVLKPSEPTIEAPIEKPVVEVPNKPSEPTPAVTVPTPAPTVEVSSPITVSKYVGFTTNELKRGIQVTALANATLTSECFTKKMMALPLIQTGNRTNAEVLKHLRKPVTIELEMYSQLIGNTVGYTYPSSKRIWMNRKYHNQYSKCQSASNLGHEGSGHKNGFTHDVNYSKERNKSVPYSINTAVESCCVEPK